METFQIEAVPNPAHTKIMRNGEQLNCVTKFVLEQEVGELSRLTLFMVPDLVEVQASDIDVEYREQNQFGLFSRPRGYDPYNRVDSP